MIRIGSVDVMEEILEADAQEIQAWFTRRGLDEAVLRTAPVAGEANVAVEAVLRQLVALVEPELHLLLRRDELEHVLFLDVAEAEPRLDEMIAGVEVASVLERERSPTSLGMDAEAGWLADPVRERDVEHLHVDLADVPPDPFLEHVDEEPAVLLRRDRAIGDVRPLLHVEGPVAPRGPRRTVLGLLGRPLDDRDELDEPRLALIA